MINKPLRLDEYRIVNAVELENSLYKGNQYTNTDRYVLLRYLKYLEFCGLKSSVFIEAFNSIKEHLASTDITTYLDEEHESKLNNILASLYIIMEKGLLHNIPEIEGDIYVVRGTDHIKAVFKGFNFNSTYAFVEYKDGSNDYAYLENVYF